MTEYVNQASFDDFQVDEIDGLPYSYHYSHEATLPVSCDEAFDLFIKDVWFGAPFTVEVEGRGRGQEGSIQKMAGGLFRKELLRAGCPDNQRIASIQYTQPSAALPFHHYKGFIRFIPKGDNSTVINWTGKFAPKRWDYKVFGGFFAGQVLKISRNATGGVFKKFTDQVSHQAEDKKQQ